MDRQKGAERQRRMHYAPAMGREELLTEREVAAWLKLSVSSLKRLRLRGEGPPYVRLGPRAVRYSPEAVREWLRQRAEEG